MSYHLRRATARYPLWSQVGRWNALYVWCKSTPAYYKPINRVSVESLHDPSRNAQRLVPSVAVGDMVSAFRKRALFAVEFRIAMAVG